MRKVLNSTKFERLLNPRGFAFIAAALFVFACGQKDHESSNHLNPSKIQGNHFTLGPWNITTPGEDGLKEYAGDSEDLGLTLDAAPFPFGAIINSRTGATRIFLANLRKDSCADYREAGLPGEIAGRTTNGGFWFVRNDDTEGFSSYVANIRRYNICLTLKISLEPGLEKFSSKDSDLIDYFNRFMETAEFRRLGKVRKSYFNNRAYLYTVFSSDINNETITDTDGMKHTYSSAPILTIDGQQNAAVSEAFFGDCQLEIFKNARADVKKKAFAVSSPSDDLTSKYSLELTTEPNGTFNRVAEAVYSSMKTTNCLIVRYHLKTPVTDPAVASSDSELDQLFVGELSNMMVSKSL